ncbi:hypothetical protein [Phenylobacterium sp.]|jgi:hypothetical protein|uniref:hypothetical protein n=1 Tax=Phenylobacterium sp. TaxID=1871053 RepID=UPI003784E87B
MKACVGLFVTARRAGAPAAAACAAFLGGCVGNPFDSAKIDPASPIATEVSRASRANTDFPSFSEIPAVPTDVRPLRLYGQSARDIRSAQADLEQKTAPSTWTLQNTDAFASGARSAVGGADVPVDPQATEAFADQLRRRATPPPSPSR